MSLTFKITGLDPVNRKFDHIDLTIIKSKNNPSSLITASVLSLAKNKAKSGFSYPGGPSYPLRWKSDRQRKAVMAKLRATGNLPYSRSRRLHNAWGAEKVSDGMVIFNDAKDPTTGEFYAHYVVGDDQQPFHADTGWSQGTESKWEPIVEAVGKEIFDDFVVELAREV